MYALVDPVSTLSYIFLLIASKYHKEPILLHHPFEVSTPVCEFVINEYIEVAM